MNFIKKLVTTRINFKYKQFSYVDHWIVHLVGKVSVQVSALTAAFS